METIDFEDIASDLCPSKESACEASWLYACIVVVGSDWPDSPAVRRGTTWHSELELAVREANHVIRADYAEGFEFKRSLELVVTRRCV